MHLRPGQLSLPGTEFSLPKDNARIWRGEGLKVPKKQKPRGRLWLNDGSCVRLRPEHANHVWSYDFVSAKTHDRRTGGGIAAVYLTYLRYV